MGDMFTIEYVRVLRQENKRRRLRVLDLEQRMIANEIAAEAMRQDLDPELIQQVQTLTVHVDDKGAVVGAREAVALVKTRSA